MKRVAVCVFCMFIVSVGTTYASEYKLNETIDSVIGSSAISLALTSVLVDAEAGSMIPEGDINPFDSALIFDYHSGLDSASTLGAYAALMIPAVTVVGNLSNGNMLLTYGIMYGEAFLLTMATKNILKLAVSRHRPYTYRGPVPSGEEDDYFNSFPSGHTAFAFLGATFLCQTFQTEYPDSRWRVPIFAASYTLAAGIGVLRVVSGNHFISDVLVGASIGTLYGWLIPKLHLDDSSSDISISIYPTISGVTMGLQY